MPTDSFEQYRPLLFSIAYRMLGSGMEAEDMVQETFLRWERVAVPVDQPKAYLCRIITRLCLDQLKAARTQREQYIGAWLPEPIPTPENSPVLASERDDSISVAVLLLMERLSPVERAVLLLRDVFDYGYDEIAGLVDRSEAACRQHYHRAKAYLSANRPRFEPTSAAHRQMVERFIAAITAGDIDGLMQFLAADVVTQGDGGGKVKGAGLRPVVGRENVARLLRSLYTRYAETPDAHAAIREVNGGLAILLWQGETLLAVVEFEILDGQFRRIYHVLNPDKLAYIARRVHPPA